MTVLVGPTGGLFFGGKKNADEPGCCLSLHRDMIHALVTRGFPSFRWFWQESVYCKRFFTKRGGRPSLSRFVFPSQLASLRGKSNSVGSEVGHYEQTSRLPNVWWRDKKGPDDLLFAPHVVVTSSLNPLKSSKGNELNAAWIQTLKKLKEQMYYGENFSTKVAQVLVWRQCLLWNQFFASQQSRVAPKLCWSKTRITYVRVIVPKNCLWPPFLRPKVLVCYILNYPRENKQKEAKSINSGLRTSLVWSSTCKCSPP